MVKKTSKLSIKHLIGDAKEKLVSMGKTIERGLSKFKIRGRRSSVCRRKNKMDSTSSLWADYEAEMKNSIDSALAKLKADIKRKAPIKEIEKDHSELLMLLGECEYIIKKFGKKQK